MQKIHLTPEEICEQAYRIFEARGYGPEYLDEDCTEFACLINGIKFSFCLLHDDIFWFGAEFELKGALSDEERALLEQLHEQIKPEDVAFENLHIRGTQVALTSAFPGYFYKTELMNLVIQILENAEGVVSCLKAKQVE